RSVTVSWAIGPHAPRNVDHHWAALVVRGKYVSLVTTEPSLAARLHRVTAIHAAWRRLSPVADEKLEAALVKGSSKTLWLSGIHRSVPTKADSKVLMGRDL